MFRTFLPTLALAFTAAPAIAENTSQQLVSFEIVLPASPAQTLDSINAQAWEACAPTPASGSILDRSPGARRACQEALVRDVVDELADPDLTAALEARDADAKG